MRARAPRARGRRLTSPRSLTEPTRARRGRPAASCGGGARAPPLAAAGAKLAHGHGGCGAGLAAAGSRRRWRPPNAWRPPRAARARRPRSPSTAPLTRARSARPKERDPVIDAARWPRRPPHGARRAAARSRRRRRRRAFGGDRTTAGGVRAARITRRARGTCRPARAAARRRGGSGPGLARARRPRRGRRRPADRRAAARRGDPARALGACARGSGRGVLRIACLIAPQHLPSARERALRATRAAVRRVVRRRRLADIVAPARRSPRGRLGLALRPCAIRAGRRVPPATVAPPASPSSGSASHSRRARRLALRTRLRSARPRCTPRAAARARGGLVAMLRRARDLLSPRERLRRVPRARCGVAPSAAVGASPRARRVRARRCSSQRLETRPPPPPPRPRAGAPRRASHELSAATACGAPAKRTRAAEQGSRRWTHRGAPQGRQRRARPRGGQREPRRRRRGGGGGGGGGRRRRRAGAGDPPRAARSSRSPPPQPHARDAELADGYGGARARRPRGFHRGASAGGSTAIAEHVPHCVRAFRPTCVALRS